jgi:hypothetical protein
MPWKTLARTPYVAFCLGRAVTTEEIQKLREQYAEEYARDHTKWKSDNDFQD